MGKKELLQQIYAALSADEEIKEVLIKYLNGNEIRFDLENEYAEMVQPADNDEDEDEDYEDYKEKAAIQIETDENNEDDEDDED
jgi:hypothetical protein